MRILIKGDVHIPYCSWPVVEECARFAEDYKPDVSVQVGDFIDAHNWSRHQRYPDSPSAQREWDLTKKGAARFHSTFDPKTWLWILEGNHDVRILARAYEANIPAELIKTFAEVFPYDNWKWHTKPDPLQLDGILFGHGNEATGTTLAIAKELARPYVHGHAHKEARIVFASLFKHTTWGMHVGCMVDKEAIGMRYTRKSYARSSLGWATITDGLPIFHDYATMRRWRRNGTRLQITTGK